jgi:hypothetical protein
MLKKLSPPPGNKRSASEVNSKLGNRVAARPPATHQRKRVLIQPEISTAGTTRDRRLSG